MLAPLLRRTGAPAVNHLRTIPLGLLVLLAACGRDAAPPATETAATPPAPPPKQEIPLIPRDALFGNPERSAAQISPDGKRIGYIAPLEGVMNVYVAPFETPDAAKPVTNDKVRPIRQYRFAYNGKHLLYLQDTGGDENFHIHAVDLDAGGVRDLTPYEGARAAIKNLSPKRPGEVLVEVNDRNKEYFDLYVVDIASGKRTLVQKNDEFGAFVVDEDYGVQLAERPTKDGGKEWLRPDGKGGWTSWA